MPLDACFFWEFVNRAFNLISSTDIDNYEKYHSKENPIRKPFKNPSKKANFVQHFLDIFQISKYRYGKSRTYYAQNG